MLRATVIAIVAAMLAVTLVCAALVLAGVLPGGTMFALWGALQLAIVLAGFVFERSRYKPIETAAPPGFERTAERFVDPSSGQAVEVWFDPRTGERRYIGARGL